MAYDWQGAADGEGSGQETARLSPGTYQVKCVEVVMGRKSGPFVSKKGDPQIMAVLVNEKEEEGTVMFTLSAKATWTLARWLSRSGVDLAAMKEKGVEPRHLAKKEVAEKFLLNRKTWVTVTEGSDPKYPNIDPIHPEEVPAGAVTPAGGDDLNLDDIPF